MAINFDELKKLSPKIKALIVCLVCIVAGLFLLHVFPSGMPWRRRWPWTPS